MGRRSIGKEDRKVYAWEDRVIGPLSNRIIPYEKAQAFVDGVWLANGWLYPPRVEKMRKDAKVFLGCRAYIKIHQDTPAWIILHELAHTLTQTIDGIGGEEAHHGPDFIGIYLKLLEKILNIPAVMLMFSLNQEGIKFNLGAQPRFNGVAA